MANFWYSVKVERRSSSPSKLFSRHSTFFSTRVHFRQNGIEEEEKIFTPRKKNFLFLFIMRKKSRSWFQGCKKWTKDWCQSQFWPFFSYASFCCFWFITDLDWTRLLPEWVTQGMDWFIDIYSKGVTPWNVSVSRLISRAAKIIEAQTTIPTSIFVLAKCRRLSTGSFDLDKLKWWIWTPVCFNTVVGEGFLKY